MDQLLYCLLSKIQARIVSPLAGPVSQDVCPLVPHAAACFGPCFEGSGVVQVLEWGQSNDLMSWGEGGPELLLPPAPAELQASRQREQRDNKGAQGFKPSQNVRSCRPSRQ